MSVPPLSLPERAVPRRLLDKLPREWRSVIGSYGAVLGGSMGRLIFSLTYFVILANTLSIAEFGVFATCSAAGVMLSRLVGFGFVSPLYRAATLRPRLIGLYTAGLLVMTLLSLPFLLAASWITWLVVFRADIGLALFLLFIASEALLWRGTEVVIIVNNGLNRFSRGAIFTIGGTVLRALAAGALFLVPQPDLAAWAMLYLLANGLSLIAAVATIYPRTRLRWAPRIWMRRLGDSLSVAGAELLFYLQGEMDKLLVLALGGAHLAGLYAIVMRLVDMTAIPIRAFTMMLVQKLMRSGAVLKSRLRTAGLEAAIFAVSTAGLLALALFVTLFPTALGDNVAEAVPLIILVLLVPGLRNLIEYQAELLYGRGQSTRRTVNLAILTPAKGAMLAAILFWAQMPSEIMIALNGLFAGLYLISAILTYRFLDHDRRVL